MTIKTWELDKFFKSDKKYIYIGKTGITNPLNDFEVNPGSKKIRTGKKWIELIMFDMSENTMPPLEEQFKEI